MAVSKGEKPSSEKAAEKRRDTVTEIANTFEWLITAFILAFMFRAFVMEAFRIPTGSMADTLKGAHFRLRCPQCGYRYDHGFIPNRYGLPEDTLPVGRVPVPVTRCPSCGHYPQPGAAMTVANGDRILVLKCIYQFFEPQRWDVIVFKDPLDPSINYIKRLIGLPGETLEIIDGDIYINGRISRKPAKVQDELWTAVYNNDHQPVRPREGVFNGHRWEQPFKTASDSRWIVDDKDRPTIFRLDSPAGQRHWIFYDSTTGNDFRATYAYDDVRDYRNMPYCSDLMVRFYARSGSRGGQIGVELSKYERRYRGWVDLRGEMVIARAERDKETILDKRKIGLATIDKSALLKFANVDHRLIFQFGREKLTYDLGCGPEDAGERKAELEPQVKIFGAGKLTLWHIAIFRDIHYTQYKYGDNGQAGRATEGRAFTLREDEFFVLGDNSPNSQDSRWWEDKGVANRGQFYRAGIVPRDYLVGKALFVYWPSGFRLYSRSRFAIIPNVGRMRFIYGGSNRNP